MPKTKREPPPDLPDIRAELDQWQEFFLLKTAYAIEEGSADEAQYWAEGSTQCRRMVEKLENCMVQLKMIRPVRRRRSRKTTDEKTDSEA